MFLLPERKEINTLSRSWTYRCAFNFAQKFWKFGLKFQVTKLFHTRKKDQNRFLDIFYPISI